MDTIGTVRQIVEYIYGPARAESVTQEIHRLMGRWGEPISRAIAERGGPKPRLSEKDAILITYGDQFQGSELQPLEYLSRFLSEHLEGVISSVHILPFFPYSSDDGFSVIDYRAVDPRLGNWDSVRAIGAEFTLMCDLVLNHCSASHEWFRKFIQWEQPYSNYFISVPPGTDVSGVVRPRALPLLTEFRTADGEKLVWTTFSADQVDLNYDEPALLLSMLEVLLFYLSVGCRIIRLDAIAYLWKELGTPCLHHPRTHAVVKLFRSVLSRIAPDSIIITETNVPHEENMSYLRDDEAHMVYQFALPPLTLHAFISGDARPLTSFARNLTRPAGEVTFFNFLASHDGVGVLPARGYLTDDQIQEVIRKVEERGGRVSYKATPAGDVPYELNVNYFDAIADPPLPDDQRARAFLASQAIMLAMPGVPGIYVHSLLGSGNWTEGVELLGHNRAINRQKFDFDELMSELGDEESLRWKVFSGYNELLLARSGIPAFDPYGAWKALDGGQAVFAILRTGTADAAGDPGMRVLCLHNVSHKPAEFVVRHSDIGLSGSRHFRDLISGDHVFPAIEERGVESEVSFDLEGYEVLWLEF
ncbi:MAG TPA: sugar phosphorylase [Spirochaetia bacterium]|nr:sugar phosphorylase [Spirochaetia bacterium]